MKPLSAGSERRVAASRFGAELRTAMLARGVGSKRLATAIRTGTSAVAVWKAGDNLPRTDTAQRLADALSWPKLVALAQAGRQGTCARCGRPWTNEGGGPKRYCSSECRDIAGALARQSGRATLAETLRDELTRTHGTTTALSKKTLKAALTTYNRSEAKRTSRSRTLSTQLAVVRAAVDAMCAGCEPQGVCREPACSLRPVSPFPIALRPRKHADEIAPAEGPWGPSHREAMQVAIAGNAERWARPGERERASEAMSARFATPELRAAAGVRVSAGRRAALARKRAV